jgi:serine/threonine protein kinase
MSFANSFYFVCRNTWRRKWLHGRAMDELLITGHLVGQLHLTLGNIFSHYLSVRLTGFSMFNIGCIAYEMLEGDPPFRSKLGAKDLFRKIMTEKVKMPDGSSSAAHKLLKGFLNRNPHQRWGVTKSTMFEVGGVSAVQQAAFFQGLDWDKLERKEVDPPDTFEVSHDDDTRHFHDEFTGMTLPRSVTIMASDDYKPKHVTSDCFRGFSFIQDDFYLPERDEEETKMYWNSGQGDCESESECASSKCDNDRIPL